MLKNEVFVKRLKSLLWRSAMMGLAVLVAGLTNVLTPLNLSPLVTTLLGLILGEVSKYLNTQTKV